VHITIGAAGGHYEGALRDIIHAFKYEGRRSLAPPLGQLMREAGAALLKDADCVVPVPLHPWRRMRRGFNQAVDLARTLDRPVVHALWRLHSTPPQMGLPARARRTNVRDAFILSPWFVRGAALSGPTTLGERSRHGPPLDNRVVVLIDDVKTTGATLNACANVLRGAGVREVRALTVAAADPPLQL
jgi:predicted amidophosphoribosyltransferase